MRRKFVQLSFLSDEGKVQSQKREQRRVREKWLTDFQKYSDKCAQQGDSPRGHCGYMDFCDCCNDNTYGRPCARAFSKYARENNIEVDYTDYDFDKYI